MLKEGAMNRPRNAELLGRTPAELADAQDLRSVISTALVASPIDEHSLRCGVWTYVGVERRLGTPPGGVITALTELVDVAGIAPPSLHQALMRRVILWCVEGYFG